MVEFQSWINTIFSENTLLDWLFRLTIQHFSAKNCDFPLENNERTTKLMQQ